MTVKFNEPFFLKKNILNLDKIVVECGKGKWATQREIKWSNLIKRNKDFSFVFAVMVYRNDELALGG